MSAVVRSDGGVDKAMKFAKALDALTTKLAAISYHSGYDSECFAFDFARKICDIERELTSGATSAEYTPSRGGCDPEHYVSDRLQREIDGAVDAEAERFIAIVDGVMGALVKIIEAQP